MTVANTLLNHKKEKKYHCSTNWENIAFVFDLIRADHTVVTNGYKGQATMLEERQ